MALAKQKENFVFKISRTFDAKRERVWKAWTDPEQVKQWFGPKGAKMLYSKIDLRSGGASRYGMEFADNKMFGQWAFTEIKAPEKIVAIVSFLDEDGNIIAHPMSPTWPLKIYSVVTFHVQAAVRRALTLNGAPMKPPILSVRRSRKARPAWSRAGAARSKTSKSFWRRASNLPGIEKGRFNSGPFFNCSMTPVYYVSRLPRCIRRWLDQAGRGSCPTAGLRRRRGERRACHHRVSCRDQDIAA
jgi:uncharacterized protein YndB with AHSA1/START domain